LAHNDDVKNKAEKLCVFECRIPGTQIKKTVRVLSIGQNARGLGIRILPPDYARLNDIQSRMIDVWDSEAEKYDLPLKSIHNAENKKLRIEQILFSPARKS